jgi:hypothetical protein
MADWEGRGEAGLYLGYSSTLMMNAVCSSKHWNLSTKLHSTTSQKTVISVLTAVRTLNVSYIYMLYFLNVMWSIIVSGEVDVKFFQSLSSKLYHIQGDHLLIITAM